MKPRVPGTSLIEALVALCVFSIGSACSAAWLMWSFGEDAKSSRSMAATAATANLIARMRANPEGLLGGHYLARATSLLDDPTTTTTTTTATATATAPSRSPSPCANGCTAAARAADDVARFRASLATWMGSAAEGSVIPRHDGTWRVAVTWRGRNELVRVVRP